MRLIQAKVLIVNLNSDEDCDLLGCPPCDGKTDCTLRQAIRKSNENDTVNNRIRFGSILFSSKPTFITLGSGLPAITKNGTSIDGSNEMGNLIEVVINRSPQMNDSYFTIDVAPDANTGHDGRNVTISHLSMIDAPDSATMINMQDGSGLRVANNLIGRYSMSGDCDFSGHGNGVRVAQVTQVGSAAQPAAYIYGNTIVCMTTGIRVGGRFVIIGIDPAGSVAPNTIGMSAMPNTTGINVQGTNITIANNTIAYNTGDGIMAATPLRATGITDVLIQDNIVRNNGRGINFARNTANGPISGNTIFRNTIFGNSGDGIQLAGKQVTDNQVVGNSIGLVAGALNGGNGITVSNGAHHNTIGGRYMKASGNLISGNSGNGILVTGNSNGNIITSNRIGLDAAGNGVIGNSADGIRLESGPKDTIIGGRGMGQRNIVVGSPQVGIHLVGVGTRRNQILANFIGTDVSGILSLPNLIGVEFQGAGGNTLGAGNYGNLIAFNAGGLNLTEGARDNAIMMNDIRANSDTAVSVDGSSFNSFFRTVIRNNGGVGIVVAGSAVANDWSEVSIYGNAGLGIDLFPAGVTANDVGDGDTGPNTLQNFPLLSGANSRRLRIAGSLNSRPNRRYSIQFYASPQCNELGNGEGQRYLGVITVNTDAGGNASFTTGVDPFPAVAAFSTGEWITAFAVDPTGNASEFSQCRQAN